MDNDDCGVRIENGKTKTEFDKSKGKYRVDGSLQARDLSVLS